MRFLKNLTPCEENRRRRTKGVATTGKKRIGGSCKLLAGVAAVGALALAVGLPSLAIAGATTQGTRVADSPTANSQTLGNADSTRYDGRVWVDKSVSTNESETFDGQTVTNDSDFLVTYSALATSTEVTGGTPSDTVFILDISASMCWGTNSTHVTSEDDSRINAMVEALNASIDTIVKANPNNRIGIAVFNGTGSVLMELTPASTILDNVTDGQYVTLQNFDGDEGKDNGKATIRCNMVEGVPTAQTAGGTNIQAGLYQGMKLLANESDTMYEGVTRTPNVILMSDGAPTTFASATDTKINGKDEGVVSRDTDTGSGDKVSSGSWWDLGEGRDEIGQIGGGDNDRAHSADGFMALATASYMKNEISEHYYGSSDKEANVYTIGFSTDRQTESMRTMANIVLNPGENLNEGIADYGFGYNEFKNLWDAYESYINRTGNATVYGHIGSRGNKNSNPDSWADMQLLPYTVEHPSGSAAANGPDSFNYPTQHFEATDTESLINAFEDIAGLITKSADVPTAVTGNPVSSGYITYTDTTGQYMDVTGIKAVIWGGQLLQLSGPDTSAAGKTTYTAAVHNDIFENADDAKIVITIEDGENNTQIITVQVPAAAIPVRVNSVELAADGTVKSNTSNEVTPLRVCYTVGLDQTGDDAVSPVTLAGVSADYIAANTSNGKVSFYSNQYQQGAENPEGAQVTFTPSNTNPFYFLQEDTPIYTSEKGDERVSSFDTEKSYWVPVSYLDGAQVVETHVERSGESMKGYTKTIDSYVYIEAGAPRLGNLEDVTGAKGTGANATGTADTYRRPTFAGTPGDEQNSKFVVYLGNNGRLDLSAPSSLTVTKATTAGTGLVAPDREFSFQITSEAMKGQAATATKTTPGTDGSASTTESVTLTFGDSGVASFTLKGGQSLEIPLPQGAAYSIVEQDATGGGYKLTGISGATTNNVNAATASGTMGSDDVAVTFTNTYEATGTMPLTITKTLQNRPFQEDDSFGFTVTQGEKNPEGGATLSSDFATIAYDADDGKGTAEKAADPLTVTFSQKGDYTFYVSETVPDDATNPNVTGADGGPISYKSATDDQKAEPGWTYKGVTYDNQAKTVTVSVTDDGNGHLTCSVDYGNQQSGLTFVNTYGENQPQVITLAGAKKLDAEPGLTKPDIEGEFTFTLSGTDEKGNPAPLPVDDQGNAVSSATNDSAGNVSFGTITFTMESVFGDEPTGSGSDSATTLQPRSKTYTYKVTESGAVAGVTNDAASTKTFTVTVNDNRQGGLSVACTDSDGNVLQPGALFSFTNTYDVPSVASTPTSSGITITKQLSGRALNKDEFSFEMRDASGDVVSTGTNAADGAVALSPVEFSVPGTYEYTIHEVKGSLGGVSYDDAVYYASATVEQNVDDATLSVTWKVSATQGGNPLTSVAFENAYEPAPVSVTLGGTKVLDGRELETGEFSFALAAPDGTELETVTNTDRGGFAFSPITYTEPGTYEYTISEVKGDAEGVTYDDATYAVKVVVTDDGQGQLQVSELTYNGEASLPVFTNTYAAPEGPAPTIPETGDTTNAAVPVLVAVVGAAVIAVAVIARRRRR